MGGSAAQMIFSSVAPPAVGYYTVSCVVLGHRDVGETVRNLTRQRELQLASRIPRPHVAQHLGVRAVRGVWDGRDAILGEFQEPRFHESGGLKNGQQLSRIDR